MRYWWLCIVYMDRPELYTLCVLYQRRQFHIEISRLENRYTILACIIWMNLPRKWELTKKSENIYNVMSYRDVKFPLWYLDGCTQKNTDWTKSRKLCIYIYTTGMLSFSFDIWMVVPRRLLTELIQENYMYMQQGSTSTLRYMDDYATIFKLTEKDVKYEYILQNAAYRNVHNIYSISMQFIYLGYSDVCLFECTNMSLPTCHLVLANATVIFVANVSIDFRIDMPKVICYLDELLQVVW